jgi:hypothetical protein
MKIIDEGEEGSRDGKADPGVAVGGLSTEKVMDFKAFQEIRRSV